MEAIECDVAAGELSPDVIQPCSIRELTLQNFRSYSALSFEVPSKSVVLVGENGAGKTNILEAISLLTPGRGLRTAKLAEIRRVKSVGGWSVSANVVQGDESHQLGTGVLDGLASEGRDSEKRVVRIDGEDKKNQHALALYFSAVWLTPQMGQMFVEGQGTRRRFFDRLVYSFDPDHASRVYAYEHTMRERNRLLSSARPDAAWLKVLEEKMAGYTVSIAAARLVALEHLGGAMRLCSSAFPAADVRLDGLAEAMLADGAQAADVEDAVAAALCDARADDGRRGRASVGAHRTEMQVFFVEKGMEASCCSTGEQKALLLSILLAHARARASWQGSAPVLLLDEVVAHLDVDRRKELFAEIASIGAQAWMTGTDAADFSAAGDTLELLQVSESAIIRSDI